MRRTFDRFFGRAASPDRARRGRAGRRLVLEDLEGRTVLSTLSVVQGVLTFTAGDAKANQVSLSYDGIAQRYTLTDPAEPITLGQGILGGVGDHTSAVSFADGNVNAISVSLKDQDDALRVFSLVDPLTVSGGDGNDAIRLGSAAGSLDPILSSVGVLGDAGMDSLVLYDQGDGSANSYTVTGGGVLRGGLTINQAGVEGLTINAGTGADTVTVLSTTASNPVRINAGAGDDVVQVGDAATTLDAIRGAVTVRGEGGADWLYANDYAVPTPDHAYAVTSTSVSRESVAPIAYDGQVENVRLNAGTGNDTVRVLSSSAATTLMVSLKAGGADTAILGSAGNSLDTILGLVNVAGELGQSGPIDSLIVNDQGDTDPNNYALSFNAGQPGTYYSQVTRNGKLLVNAANLKGLVLNAGLNNDVINVVGTAPTDHVTVNAGAGDDTIRVGAYGGVATVLGPLFVDGQAGVDSLVIDDSADGPDAFLITSTQVLRNGSVLLRHLGIEVFTISP